VTARASTPPRALLVSLRDPDDPMAAHEHACFARAAELPPEHLGVHVMATGPLRAVPAGMDAVFFGGSGAYSVLDDVQWIRDGLDALRCVLDARVPAWASCFGFQGLAVALGGEVRHDPTTEEMGSTWITLTEAGQRDPLLGRIGPAFWAQEGHHDRVTVLPEGVERLATGALCPEQAFRVSGAPFWAAQFHPELTVARTVERFVHYRDHYFTGPPEEAEALLHRLRRGEESPGVSDLLARLVRGDLDR
jgi:GMP synthase (glutamine-hydrolysing)